MKKYRVEEIERVRDDLLRGEIVAFGTDTVFGLACVFDNIEAIKKIYAAKNREAKKALPMMCSSASMIEKVAFVDGDAKNIFDTDDISDTLINDFISQISPKYAPNSIKTFSINKARLFSPVTSGFTTLLSYKDF